jgi:PPK2 family polyphosphate:nucleotide phosphotransferase
MKIDKYLICKDKNSLNSFKTDETLLVKSRAEAEEKLKKNIVTLDELQAKLYASDKYSFLIILQAMDAAGKDGIIKHVLSGLNPHGTQVFSFKAPSYNELKHDYLWRIHRSVPERGRIGIFNRSHYEDVLVVRVHDLVRKHQIPPDLLKDDIWEKRFRQINDFEKHLYENGTVIVKIFLHLSKEEQKKRFLSRLEKESKNWKFSAGDLEERQYWDKYQFCYEEAINATSKKQAPWYVVPADNKWYSRLIVSEILINTFQKLDIGFPSLSTEQKKKLLEYKENLLAE